MLCKRTAAPVTINGNDLPLNLLRPALYSPKAMRPLQLMANTPGPYGSHTAVVSGVARHFSTAQVTKGQGVR